MSFELSFLGASGGPIEASTCSLLVKPANIDYSYISQLPSSPLLLIDAGSGFLLLAEIIANEKDAPNKLLRLYPDSDPISSYLAAQRSSPFQSMNSSAPLRTSRNIISMIPTILITHPHLDHILALVLNSADPVPNCITKNVYASAFTIEAIKRHVFNWKIWPNMALLGHFNLCPILSNSPFPANDSLYSINSFDLQHGTVPITEQSPASVDSTSPYTSLAYLITHNPSLAKLLAFGDFESDAVLGKSLNRHIWKSVAPYVDDGTLKAIILECSVPTCAPDRPLYGHLMPEHVVHELSVLHSLCSKPHKLSGVQIIVSHVKEDLDGFDPRKTILAELRLLSLRKGLDIKFTVALSGLLLVV